MSCLIEMKNIGFSVQGRALIQDISCQFEEGVTTALIGPSGGGKSTVLKLAAGLFPPSSGEVFFRGRNIVHMSRSENLAFRKEGAVVFQDSALWANQTLFQTLELPLLVHFPKMTKKERERRIESVAADVGYKKELGIRPAQLSMGEQKLLAFARAMMCHPRLLYLDEWTESLDESASRRLIGLVKNFRKDGVSIILVSHDIRIIRDIADIVIVVSGGRISLRLTKEEIDNDSGLSGLIERGMAS